jgi:hypothetical protein
MKVHKGVLQFLNTIGIKNIAAGYITEFEEGVHSVHHVNDNWYQAINCWKINLDCRWTSVKCITNEREVDTFINAFESSPVHCLKS